MRKLTAASVAMLLAIALYFTLFWGFEALRMLTSPTYGLDDVWRSQTIFALGSIAGLAPEGLLKLAAFIATLKLAVAVICAIHIADRLRTLIAGEADVQVLEAGLILVVAISIATVGPAVWSQNVELARESTIQLLLAGVATALCLVERSYARKTQTEEAGEPADMDVETETAAPQAAGWFAPWR